LEFRRTLLERAAEYPLEPHPPPPRAAPVLETVTLVPEVANRPMRACEIHAATSELLGAPLRWRSVNGILSAYTIGRDRRFRRIRRGVYELAAREQASNASRRRRMPAAEPAQ
jgi:hypothetical protein